MKTVTMSASDQNSNMTFLRNDFFFIFEDLFTTTLLTKMTHINDQTKTFGNLLPVKCLLENYSNLMGVLSPIRQPGS